MDRVLTYHQPERASEILQATKYAANSPPARDGEEWESFILKALRNIRKADRHNWHHRMTVRAAHVIYDDAPDSIVAAAAARHELNGQIFTRTMEVKVWKPDFERAGRHFVYTSRYVSFFTQLLLQLNDRASLKALTARVRKRQADFYDHSRVWFRVCVTYIALLRSSIKLPRHYDERILKSLSYDRYTKNRTALENWCNEPASTEHRVLITLRDAIELQKLDAGLFAKQSTDIDDMVIEAYVNLHETVVPTLSSAQDTESDPEMRAKAEGDTPAVEGQDLLARERPVWLQNLNLPMGPTSRISDIARPPPTTAPKTKVKALSRKEALRDAETVASKMPGWIEAMPSANGTSKTQRNTATHQEAHSPRRHSQFDMESHEVVTKVDDETEGEESSSTARFQALDALGSSPLTVLDSGDEDTIPDTRDDFDLNDDQEEPKPLFPNLVSGGQSINAPGGLGQSDTEEADGNEGDDENDEQEDEGSEAGDEGRMRGGHLSEADISLEENTTDFALGDGDKDMGTGD